MTRRKDPPRPIGQTMVTLACIHCGAVILRRIGHHSRNVRLGRDGPYCSKRCSALHHPRMVARQLDPDLFWARVARAGMDDCWPWMGARQTSGYGNVAVARVWLRTHRVAYELAKGPIPAGMLVMHTCDNPPCCNPAHLQVGTYADNMRDMIAKGRAAAHMKGKTPTAMRGAADRLGEAMG